MTEIGSEVIIIGSGMAGLTAAALLAKQGTNITILEQNWLPGGCSSSYPRHHFIFEAGATTLIGLDPGMPLRELIDRCGIQIEPWLLTVPMKVHLKNGTILTRWQDLDRWIAECEQAFGTKGQRAFWEYCQKVSDFVWETSVKQTHFPPTRLKDLFHLAGNARLKQFRFLTLAYKSVESLLNKFGLENNQAFRQFVDEQLMITAQNTAEEVNVLFGATALCYTHYGNYYMPGGLLELVKPIVDFVEQKGGEIRYRCQVTGVEREGEGYVVHTRKHGDFRAKYVISGIPLNNTLPLMGEQLTKKWSKKLLKGEKLTGAFSMGIAMKRSFTPDCLHQQIHLREPLPGVDAHSIFVSLSHPDDHQRCAPDEMVASISTHISITGAPEGFDKSAVEERIIDILEEKGLLKRENILYRHSSTPGGWEKWTLREDGFVGGYPQYMSIKPWQMKDARLDGHRAYICGDSTYPGQGIPGVCLSGICAVAKMRSDWKELRQ